MRSIIFYCTIVIITFCASVGISSSLISTSRIFAILDKVSSVGWVVLVNDSREVLGEGFVEI